MRNRIRELTRGDKVLCLIEISHDAYPENRQYVTEVHQILPGGKRTRGVWDSSTSYADPEEAWRKGQQHFDDH
ncbi:hypothetical protein [Dyella sp. RRB7]|uniref:hypothetical protein n=1 Tax=Dyella sp. RRB7 TaxID=2919502 RepID=UPI001FAAE171|nr:hypothetical protein [Dyella sp. RRB7]